MSRIRGLLKVIWALLACVLVMTTLWYWALELIAHFSSMVQGHADERISVFAQLPLIILILAILYIVEGAETAVSALLDKDPEQIPEGRGRVARSIKEVAHRS